MPTEVIEEAIPVAEVVPSPYQAAAGFLEQAAKAAPQDPHIAYLLAVAYKRDGKPAEARQVLRKISRPDANVLLQLGLLSLQEGQLAQAEQEFARAWEMDSTSYEACSNLLLTRLTLGQFERCDTMLPQALALATAPDEQRFLRVLQSLLRHRDNPDERIPMDPVLQDLTAADEQRLLKLLRSLGQPDTTLALLKALAAARPSSPAVQDAYVEAALVQARQLMDRYLWGEAERLLQPLARNRRGARAIQASLLNLLGCCACLVQDFEEGVRDFNQAIKLVGNDPRLYQNLALAYELQGDIDEAEGYWDRYLDLLDRRLPCPPDIPNYVDRLSFESVNRLVTLYMERERWHDAVGYAERAQRLRPGESDVLERLFHLYNQAKRPDEARRTLRRLRDLKPNEPQYELYELDLVEPKNLKDIEGMLTRIDDILKRYPNDPRVEERAVRVVGNVVPLMSSLCEQLTDQMSRIIDQVRSLPNYQINWSAVHDAMRDLVREFRKLRRITGKCLPLVTHDEHKRIIRDLTTQIDRKIEMCQSMGG